MYLVFCNKLFMPIKLCSRHLSACAYTPRTNASCACVARTTWHYVLQYSAVQRSLYIGRDACHLEPWTSWLSLASGVVTEDYWLDPTTGLFVATVHVSILNNCTRCPFYRLHVLQYEFALDIKHGWHLSLSLSLSLSLVANMCAWRSLCFSPSRWSVVFRVSQALRVVRNPSTSNSAVATRVTRVGWPREGCGPLSRQWIR